MKYIFLDFDGVLHGKKDEMFTHSSFFCQTIRPYKDNISIIISSSWRETYPFDVLTHHFDEDIIPLVVGITPILSNGFDDTGRFLEIIKYCEEHSIASDDWIALDDMERLFPSPCENLLLIDIQKGIQQQDMNKLISFLNYQPHSILTKKI